ncbi:MAG: ABC transporter ATP-binding protein [Pseudomonadota bacterium]|nr:ABC transporter ATP-binding protein [Pseudomonadota bacterium]
MAPVSPPLIDIRNARLTLRSLAGPVEILRGVDFTANVGEAIGIVGPSGSGKTTLLMVIGGLERVTGGQAIIDGQDLGLLNEDELTRFRRDRLGIVFQSFHLITTMTALENVAIPLELKGAPQAFAQAEEKLRAVGLGHRLVHYPGELSGGEQQRVAIARALAAGVRIILADEPTGNLDQATGGQILDLLFDFNAREGLTLLLVTHDPETARRCHRIVELRDGLAMQAA